MLEMQKHLDETAFIVCGHEIYPNEIKVPALRQIIKELAHGDQATIVSCRHKDWSQQAQCGCVMGCLGG